MIVVKRKSIKILAKKKETNLDDKENKKEIKDDRKKESSQMIKKEIITCITRESDKIRIRYYI